MCHFWKCTIRWPFTNVIEFCEGSYETFVFWTSLSKFYFSNVSCKQNINLHLVILTYYLRTVVILYCTYDKIKKYSRWKFIQSKVGTGNKTPLLITHLSTLTQIIGKIDATAQCLAKQTRGNCGGDNSSHIRSGITVQGHGRVVVIITSGKSIQDMDS